MRNKISQTNQRVRLTKRLFQEALITLLEEKTIDKISVTELCQLAQLNRTTFYQHYGQPMDILNEMEESLLADARSFVSALDSEAKTQEKIEKLLTYVKANQSRFSLLVFRNGRDDFRQIFLENIMSCLIPHVEDYERADVYRYSYMTSGSFAVVFNWAMTGYKTSPAKLAALINDYARKLSVDDI